MAPKVIKRLAIPLSLASAVFLLVYTIGTFIFSLQNLEESSRKVEHSYLLIGTLQNILINTGRMERGLRGYLLTQNKDFLATYQMGFSRIYKELENAENLASDHSEEENGLESLRSLVNKKIKISEALLGTCREGRFPEALRRFRDSETQPLMTAIEARISGLVHQEYTQLANRKELETESSRHVIRVILLSGTLTPLFASLAAYFIFLRRKERDQYMRLILKNEQLLFQFLEAIPVGIFVLDAAGDPYYANQTSKELLGRGLVREKGLDHLTETYQIYMAGTNELYPISKTPLVRAMFGEKTNASDLEIHRGNQIIPIQVWGTPVFYENKKIKYAIAAFVDITDRREIEEMKDDLISIVSHQLKTPVAQINGFIENLLEGIAGELTPKQSEYLTDMRDIGLENYRLISDLLNVSKIERGVLTVDVQRVDLDQVVKTACRDYEAKILAKGLAFKIEGLNQGIKVMADVDKTVETVRNLIDNALKCTDRGGITVTVKTEGLYGVIEVRDTGIGISEEDMGRLFTKSRLMGKESTRAGAGIGLYIVKNFMALQSSLITSTSQPGRGSCFKVSIPRTGSEKPK